MKSLNSRFTEKLNQISTRTDANSSTTTTREFDYVFNVIPKSTPSILRKCTRCGNNRFASSDKFRVNANKKVIDVWLVYRCNSCDYTLNVDILSRKSVASIDAELLRSFHENDISLAWKYAFSSTVFEKNTVYRDIEFEVEPPSIALCLNTLAVKGVAISILFKSEYSLKISIHKILRKVLGLSRHQLDKRHTKGDIEIWTRQGNCISLKNSIGFGCKIRISP